MSSSYRNSCSFRLANVFYFLPWRKNLGAVASESIYAITIMLVVVLAQNLSGTILLFPDQLSFLACLLGSTFKKAVIYV